MTKVAEWDERGFRCIIQTGTFGQLNGYVGVREHPWYGIQYNQCLEGCEGVIYDGKKRHPCTLESGHKSPEGVVKVHGGITYSEEGDGDFLPKGYWWFGFGCAELQDYIPLSPIEGTKYRDENYVRGEIEKLVWQLSRARMSVPLKKLMEQSGTQSSHESDWKAAFI